MSHPHPPLLLTPIDKPYVWGTETWLIAAHPDGDCPLARGELPPPPLTLTALTTRLGTALVGTRAPDPTRFPLLFKRIAAQARLSVQVHPSNATAPLTHGDPKTEMWYVLGHTNTAYLYAGLRPGTTPSALRAALANGTIEQCLTKIPITAGQSLLIPGGLVHAIGEGCLIYEVQQNSNTTYRLFDWNRPGTGPTPRPLHIEESLKVIDWTHPPTHLRPPSVTHTTPHAIWADVISCDYFNVKKLIISGTQTIPLDGTTFHALFIESGNVQIESGATTHTLTPGTSLLIPASTPHYTLTPSATPTTLLLTTL